MAYSFSLLHSVWSLWNHVKYVHGRAWNMADFLPGASPRVRTWVKWRGIYSRRNFSLYIVGAFFVVLCHLQCVAHFFASTQASRFFFCFGPPREVGRCLWSGAARGVRRRTVHGHAHAVVWAWPSAQLVKPVSLPVTGMCNSLLWGSSPWPYAYEAHALPAELKRPCVLGQGIPYCTFLQHLQCVCNVSTTLAWDLMLRFLCRGVRRWGVASAAFSWSSCQRHLQAPVPLTNIHDDHT